MLLQHFGQGFKLGARIYRAGGVGRRADYQGARMRRYGSLELGRGDFEVLLYAGAYAYGFAFGKFYHLRIANPIWCGDYDFVACLNDRHYDVADTLFCTVGA